MIEFRQRSYNLCPSPLGRLCWLNGLSSFHHPCSVPVVGVQGPRLDLELLFRSVVRVLVWRKRDRNIMLHRRGPVRKKCEYHLEARRGEATVLAFTTACLISPAIIEDSATSSNASWSLPSFPFCEISTRFTSCILSSGCAPPIPSSSKLNHKPGYRRSSPGYVGPNVRLTMTRLRISSEDESTASLYRNVTGGLGSRSFRRQIVCRRWCFPENKRSRWGRRCRMIGVTDDASGSYLISTWGNACWRLRNKSRTAHNDEPIGDSMSDFQLVDNQETILTYLKLA